MSRVRIRAASVVLASGGFEWNPALRNFDQKYLDRYPVAGSSSAQPWMTWMIRADALHELARVAGVDQDRLLTTVSAFNEHARQGADPAFGRGENPQDRHLGDPAVKPNPCLAPVERSPFYAVPVHAGVLGTAGGLATDADGRVLDHEGDHLPGLYAAGNCASTLFRDVYPGGGATLGSAIVRAHRVGRELARNREAV